MNNINNNVAARTTLPTLDEVLSGCPDRHMARALREQYAPLGDRGIIFAAGAMLRLFDVPLFLTYERLMMVRPLLYAAADELRELLRHADQHCFGDAPAPQYNSRPAGYRKHEVAAVLADILRLREDLEGAASLSGLDFLGLRIALERADEMGEDFFGALGAEAFDVLGEDPRFVKLATRALETGELPWWIEPTTRKGRAQP